MTLTSPRFAGNARLEQAAQNSPAMRWRESGEAVRIIQQAFIDLGFPMPISTKRIGSPDGIFGAETYNTTKAFQTKFGLPVDGVVGRQTMAKLDGLLAGGRDHVLGSTAIGQLVADVGHDAARDRGQGQQSGAAGLQESSPG